MKTEIISIGTEVLMGNITNNNAKLIANICISNGHYVYYHSVIGDNMERAVEVITNSYNRSELIIITGGLGPTFDDITREAISKALDIKLEYSTEIEEFIKSKYKKLEFVDSIKNQCIKFVDSTIIFNDNGSACGYIINKNNKILISLPGPTNECIPMLIKSLDSIKEYASLPVYSKFICISNITEVECENLIKDIKLDNDVTIAPYCGFMNVKLRLSVSAINEESANDLFLPIIKKLKKILGDNIYSVDNESIENSLVKTLIEKNYTISLAESCTGGMISSRIINVPDVSKVIKEAFITYSNKSKENILSIPKFMIDEFGSVSYSTALEMITGLNKISETSCAIAITGVSGPSCDEKNNKIGSTYIATRVGEDIKVIKYIFNGDSRNKNRSMATDAALYQLRNHIFNLKNNYIKCETY